MRQKFVRILTIIGLMTLVMWTAGLEEAHGQERPGPFHDLGWNIADSFTGWNAALHLGGIGATALMSPTGVDYEIHRFFNERPSLGEPTFPAVSMGTLTPILVGGGLLGYGYLGDSDREVAAGWAAVQATVISFAYVNLLKAITGRPPPPEDDPTLDAREESERWRFGFLRGGVFWGWPSGHTIVTMALMTSMATFYDDKWWVGALAYGWAAYTAYAVISFDEGTMHWASDMVAGVLMGYAIGSTVGNSYQRALEPDESKDSVEMRVGPQLGAGSAGLQWTFRF